MTTLSQIDQWASERFAVEFFIGLETHLRRSADAIADAKSGRIPAMIGAKVVDFAGDCYAWEKVGDVRWILDGGAATQAEVDELSAWLDLRVPQWRTLTNGYGTSSVRIEPLSQNMLWRGERLGHVLGEGRRAADEDL